MKVETHELGLLAADLERAGRDITKPVAKTTGMACLTVKRDVQRRWSGIPHLPHLPRAISYDVRTHGSVVIGEVGADHEKPQGKLAWTQENGTPTSAPHPAFAPAGDKELPVWALWLDKVAAEAIDDR
jgi:hypothetical protein